MERKSGGPLCNSLLSMKLRLEWGHGDCTTGSYLSVDPLSDPYGQCDGLSSDACVDAIFTAPYFGEDIASGDAATTRDGIVQSAERDASDPNWRDLDLWGVWSAPCIDGGSACVGTAAEEVRCVDGTRPVFYVEKAEDDSGQPIESGQWLFWFHGGNLSAGATSAWDDVRDGSFRGGSHAATYFRDRARGVLNPNLPASMNPFKQFNRVWLPDICAVDNFGGQAEVVLETPDGEAPAFFHGHRMLKAMFNTLADGGVSYEDENGVQTLPALNQSSRIVLIGWSGGGRHIIQNLDFFDQWFRSDSDFDHQAPASLHVAGVVDSRVQPGAEIQAAFWRDDDGDELNDYLSEAGTCSGSCLDTNIDGRIDVDEARLAPFDLYDQVVFSGSSPGRLPANGCLEDVLNAPPGFTESAFIDHDGDGRQCPDDLPATTESLFSTFKYEPSGQFHDDQIAWQTPLDASCVAAHTASGTVDRCREWQHVLFNHISSPVFIRQGLHDTAYRSPRKLPSYAHDADYYLRWDDMDWRNTLQLEHYLSLFEVASEMATGADVSLCTDGNGPGPSGPCFADFSDRPLGVFAPSVWSHDGSNHDGQSFGVHLCADGVPAGTFAEALATWLTGSHVAALEGVVGGPAEWTRCELTGGGTCHDGVDGVDGDGLIDCDDPECEPAEACNCRDLDDNDGDGRVDACDDECPGDCQEGVHYLNCVDGLDNDGDGFFDAADDGCWLPGTIFQDGFESADTSAWS